MDPYVMRMSDNKSFPYMEYVFAIAPQSFIIAIMNKCGVKTDYTINGGSLLHVAVKFNCFDVVIFLLEECSGIDVNATTHDYLWPLLHLAYSGVARPGPTRACALPSTFQALPSRASKSHVIL